MGVMEAGMKGSRVEKLKGLKEITANSRWFVSAMLCGAFQLCILLAIPNFVPDAMAKHTASRVVYGPEYLYVTIKGQLYYYVVDRKEGRLLEKVGVDSPPCGGFISKNGEFFYIALGELDRIAVVNTRTNLIEHEISLNEDRQGYLDPGGMAVSPAGDTIYVANESGDSLSVVDLATRLVDARIPVGFGPQDVALSPDGRYAYLTDFYAVWVVDTRDRKPIAKIAFRNPSGDSDRTYREGDGEVVYKGPRDIVLSPLGDKAYVALEDSGEIAVLDTRRNHVTATIPVGSYPGGLALSPDGHYLYIAHRDSDEISVLNTVRQEVIKKVKVGKAPWDIALSPDGAEGYVVNQDDASISVIDMKTFKVKSTILLGMIGFKNLLPRGVRRMFYVWRKQKKRIRHLPFPSVLFAILFFLPFAFAMLDPVASGASGLKPSPAGSLAGLERPAARDPGKASVSTFIRGAPVPDGQRIVFESRRSGSWEIYAMSLDGANQARLTHTGAENRAPFWSLDGKKIAFVSDRDGNKEIYMMNADGTGQRNLSRSAGPDFSPAWSPDGRRIAFVSMRDGKRNVYVMDPDGKRQVRLTSEGDNWNPNWSPDGRQIAYVSNRDGNNEIYLMNRTGENIRNLTRHPAEDGRGSHSWSPDGSRIAWVTNRDGNWEIYVMDADGRHPVNVTHHPGEEGIGMFVWSPDGARIAFISKRDNNEEIYVVNVDGSGTSNLSRSPGMDDIPLWSPDGRKLAFVSNRTGFDEIYVMDADGGHQLQLTFTRTKEDYPRWQPLGELN
jgi:YVTN family beta-propeller protein